MSTLEKVLYKLTSEELELLATAIHDEPNLRATVMAAAEKKRSWEQSVHDVVKSLEAMQIRIQS